MKRRLPYSALLALCLALAAGQPVRAAESPFEGQLLRLTEILGALHYLRNLCGEEGQDWRERMEAFLDAENPDETRRARFIANFNRSYSGFATTYSTCTDSALATINHKMK